MSDALVAPTPTGRRAASAPVRLATMAGRAVRLSARQIDAMITALLLPIMLMLMFVYLFGGAIHTGTRYVTYVVPGILLLCAAFGAATTAVSVSQDMTGGIMDRYRSMDVGGAAVISGHVVASLIRNAASTLLVFGLAFLIGFRPAARPGQWLGAVAVLLLFILAMSWLAAATGILAGSPEAANGLTFLLAFLPYPSSAFVPISTMPAGLRPFAENQPVTPVIETVRGLLLGVPVGTYPWRAVAWCAGILAVSVVLSAWLFHRRTG